MRSLLRNQLAGRRPSTEDVLPDPLTPGAGQPAAVLPLLRALAADPRPQELSGFDEPLASFRAAFPSTPPRARTTWRPSMLSTLLGAKLGATIAGVAVGLGGTAVAAYTGALPTSVQNVAHTTIGAPAARTAATPKPSAKPSATPKPSGTHQPVGPDATGPAAFGLCNAWTHHQANAARPHDEADDKADEQPGEQPKDSVAFKNLAKAAGGEAKIAAYCAKVPHPGNGKADKARGKDEPKKAHPTGKPTTHPTGKPTTHPTVKPS